MSIKWFAWRSTGLFAMLLGVVICIFVVIVVGIAAIPLELGYLVKGFMADKGIETLTPVTIEG